MWPSCGLPKKGHTGDKGRMGLASCQQRNIKKMESNSFYRHPVLTVVEREGATFLASLTRALIPP